MIVNHEDRKCTKEECNGKVCWQGFPKGECPLRKLENEKLFLGVLLSLATALLLWYAHG